MLCSLLQNHTIPILFYRTGSVFSSSGSSVWVPCQALLPSPTKGLSLSSHIVTPSQAQIFLSFCPSPALLAITPQATPSPQFPESRLAGVGPVPRSSGSEETTTDLPITSHTFTKESTSLNLALPSLLATTFPRSPTCL